MLIEFKTRNFRSLCETAEFSMVAARLTAKDKALDRDNVFVVDKELSLLRTAAIYGANAGGKSNFVRALRFMRDFVQNSSRETQIGDPIPVEPFLLRDDLASAPSSFEIVFVHNGAQYRYGFEVDARRVHAEWLFYRRSSRERTLFERAFQTIELGPDFRKEGKDLAERTRPNALFLSVAAQWDGPIATALLGWFRALRVAAGVPDLETSQATLAQLRNGGDEQAAVVRLIRSLDLGIEDLRLAKTEGGLADELTALEVGYSDILRQVTVARSARVQTSHRRYSAAGEPLAPLDLDLDRHESDGTQKLFALAGLLLGVLRRGEVLVADELDLRLHPLMTRELVRLFHGATNPRNAQLVFTTHDTNLLGVDLFRRDQVWFAEKDRQGATHLYSLAEFKVRNDASFEKDYILGKFGAIPFLGGVKILADEPGDG